MKILTPLAYFITFTCYGARLHAGNNSSVDCHNNTFNTPCLSANPMRHNYVKDRMQEAPYLLDATRRNIVLKAIVDTANYYNWKLYATHVRTNHIHLVVQSNESPEHIMNKLKSYASRYLNAAGIDHDRIKRWTRHGSTKNLWDDIDMSSVIHYVVHQQGNPMAVYENSL